MIQNRIENGIIHPDGNWTQEYMDRLGRMGWEFQIAKSNLVAAQDLRASQLIETWRQTGAPVEISIVAVMPNGHLGELPARALGYAASALSYADYLRNTGVGIDSLRIVSPCHVNAFVNGGNRHSQAQNAERFQDLVVAYKNGYRPALSGMDVTLDLGKPIQDEIVPTLAVKALEIATTQPTLTAELVRVSQRYNSNGTVDHGIDQNHLPLVYLLAHPEAWGYSAEELLFARNGERRINFVPQSELRYLLATTQIRGIWNPADDNEIGTVVSGKQRFAPYYKVWKGQIPTPQTKYDEEGRMAEKTVFVGEPTLADISKMGKLEAILTTLSSRNGSPEIAENITGLNQIRSDLQRASRNKPPKIHELINGVLT